MKAIVSIALFTFLTVPMWAQSEKEINPSNVKVEKVGDDLNVSFGVDVGKNATKRNYKHTIVPVLFNGTNSQELTPIVVESKRMKWIAEREQISKGKRNATPQPTVVKTSNGQSVAYNQNVAFESWMRGSSLRFDYYKEGCCNAYMLGTQTIASNLVPNKNIVPNIERTVNLSSTTAGGEKKWDFEKGAVEVRFKVRSTTIDENLFDNRKSLKEISDAVKSIQSKPGSAITKVEITGFASPEGTRALNINLAQGRANALKTYVTQQAPSLNESNFMINNGEINWSGLKKMVEASNMQYRDEVLNVMNTSPESQLKKNLMDLRGGRPFNYMLANYFPELRNACYLSLYYNTPQKDDKAGETINSGLKLVNDKKYKEALPILLKAQDDSRSWNAIGVCYMMMDDYDQAKSYFQRSVKDGNQMARKNLEEIMIREQK